MSSEYFRLSDLGDSGISGPASDRQVNSFDHAVRPGVVLFLGSADDCAGRVQLSSGTIVARATTFGGPYHECAIVPRPRWRSLTMADRRALIAESCPTFHGNAISVIRLPSELLERLRPLRVTGLEYSSKKNHIPNTGDQNRSEGPDAIIAYLRQRLQHSSGIEDCAIDGGVFTNPPRLQTVTWDPDTEAFIGLHVDSWYAEDFPLNRREHAPNRVCVNLGQEDRYFLFLNIAISQMYQSVKCTDTRAAGAHGLSSGARAFMSSYPSYPVVRVRIRPGEAYVAPTENIAHDGSSIDMSTTDVTLSIRGRFELCPT